MSRYPTFEQQLANVYTEPNTGCWLWPGVQHGKWYGRHTEKGVRKYAHRLSYEYHKGPIPEGLSVLHKCDVPLCINPDHLWAGTHLENVADMVAKNRHAKERSGPRGEGTANAKLNEAQVMEILGEQGRHGDIGKRYGVSQHAVSCIKRGATWKHVYAPLS